MKKNFMTMAVLSLALTAGIPAFTSCSGNTDEAGTAVETDEYAEEEATETDGNVIQAAYETPETFKNAFELATANYLALKDALVASNADEAKQHATALVASLEDVDASMLEGDAAQKWRSVAGELQAGAADIAGTTDLGQQRKAFTALSTNMIAATEAFGAGSTVYKQYCPMANNNAGGSWLSSKKEVRNPYYGDAMLECGEVQATIRDKQ
ncbi:DUF3347 domain-containing protein [Botryobacter ruber]|uniref:DUF3347 domain-containing protein n=1 Tax=Botryobacter ruber TaxID=2171629 RepID=UPI000E0AC85B|nr:DUF3347 domain-containing protein [Botryobacter ruber]